jgi:membrane fusion protein, multidrug efflux system
MKQLLIIFASTLLLIGCGKKDENINVDDLVKSKNVKDIKAKRDLLQADLTKLDEALATLDVKKAEEALVSVLVVKDTIFNHYLEIQGNVNTKENILVQPEMPGNLIVLNVKAGQRVSKGQVLGRVDDSGMSQQLASIENQYNLAKTTFERQKNLWDQKIGSEIQFLQAQAQMVGLQKSVLQMKAQLSKTLIRAPFTGVIDEVFAERGQVVAPSAQGLMRIVNLSNMYVSTAVPEIYIGKLKVGSVVNVRLESLGKNYVGHVRQVGNNINPANRSFGIEVSVPNPENLLRPNQVAKLQIIDYSKKNAIVIPTNIIQSNGDGTKFVYVADKINGKTAIAKKVIITLGQSSENVTEILSGLDATDTIVTEGLNTIQEGTKLNF